MSEFQSQASERSFKGSAIIAIIVFGLFLALSGLCTGLFAWDAETGNGGGYSPRHWYEALMIGAVGIVPGGLGLWAGLRAYKRRANWVSVVIYLLLGIPSLIFLTLAIISGISEMLRYDRMLSSAGVGLVILGLFLGLALMLTIAAIRMILVLRAPKSLSGDPFS